MRNEVSCGVDDFKRVVSEYEILTAMPQTYDSYLNHVPEGMPSMAYLPPDVYPESMRFTVAFFALEMRKALACLTTNSRGSKVSNLINDLQKVLNKRLSVTEKLIKCLKKKDGANNSNTLYGQPENGEQSQQYRQNLSQYGQQQQQQSDALHLSQLYSYG